MANIMRLGGDGKKAEGEIPITANGIYDVAEYASANVNVQSAPVLLWTNASPTSAFAAQKISIDTTEYDGILVEMRGSVSIDYTSITFVQKGTAYPVAAFSTQKAQNTTSAYVRNFTVHDDYVQVTTCWPYTGSSSTTSTSYGIPTRIWGVKFTL